MEILEFSIEQKQLLSVFKEYRNTIDIYTEDEEKDKEFYKILFSRLLEGENIIVEDIYPLGPRKEVMKRCIADTDDSRKKLYIIDGDIFLLYESDNIVKNLFVLDSYCIENFVIDQDSIAHTAYTLHGCMPLDEIYQKLQYETTISSISYPLIDLFFHYSIQHECLGMYELFHIDMYMKNDKSSIDVSKITTKNQEIKEKLLHNGITEEQYQLLLWKRSQGFPINIENLLKIVSGKVFLIPFVKHHLKRTLNCEIRIKDEAWKFNLARHCNLARLSKLKQAILSA